MKRTRDDIAEAPGHDSFLDVVANMVGIMVILVMAVGVRTKDALLTQRQPDPAPAAAVPSPEATKLAAARQTAAALAAEVRDLAMTGANVQQLAAQRLRERSQMQQLTLAAEQLIDEQRRQLSSAEQADFDLRRQLQATRDELDQIDTARVAVENTVAPVTVLKHVPTPLAKTVFGQEEHYRLLGGRLVRVPLNELVEAMKSQAELKIYKLQESPEITETIGPVDGFTMKYALRRTKMAVQTSEGSMLREVADLAGFMLVPESNDLGEPVAVALAEGAEFRRRIAQLDPNRTTITIWTYPDSFAEFRTLQQYLYAKGFLTAGRPMPAGHPIGGSPNGTRSGAQ